MVTAQIIALGGGGFSEEPGNPLLDLYVLQAAPKKSPKICFLPTASGDAEGYIEKFYACFKGYECVPSHLSVFKPHTADMTDFLLSQDILYVGGGNTKSMLALWREWQIDAALKDALKHGIVLAGISAGAICWFEEGATDSIPGRISVLPCLGFLPGSCCPHFDAEPLRREAVPRLIKEGTMKPGYAIDNSAALHFVDGSLKACVSSIPGRKAIHLSARTASDLKTTYLG